MSLFGTGSLLTLLFLSNPTCWWIFSLQSCVSECGAPLREEMQRKESIRAQLE